MSWIEDWTKRIDILKHDMLAAAYDIRDEKELKKQGFFERHFINLLFLSLMIIFICICVFFGWDLMLRVCLFILGIMLLQWIVGGFVKLWKKMKALRALKAFMRNGRR